MKQNKYFWFALFSACGILMVFGLQNCSPVSADALSAGNNIVTAVGNPQTDPPVTTPTTLPPVEVVKKSCANSMPREKMVQLLFPKTSGQTCDWNNNGNLGKKDLYLQARIEQSVPVDIPANSIICDMEFEFSVQPFLYDDHFLLTLNNSVIASSYDMNGILPVASGAYQYDWMAIRGKPWITSKETTYCLGAAQGLSSCSWPHTDVAGQIKIDYSKQLVQGLSAQDLNKSQHVFKFVSIGDNDNLDCEHAEVRATARIYYVEKE